MESLNRVCIWVIGYGLNFLYYQYPSHIVDNMASELKCVVGQQLMQTPCSAIICFSTAASMPSAVLSGMSTAMGQRVNIYSAVMMYAFP